MKKQPYPNTSLLIPQPARIEQLDETYHLPNTGHIVIDTPRLLFSAQWLQRHPALKAGYQIVSQHHDEQFAIFLHHQPAEPEAYQLQTQPNRIDITGDEAGIFYGVGTLSQLLRLYEKNLPCLAISDAPALQHRGVMLDISRNKVPTMTTLYKLVDMLAALKINELQLYIEHTFAYQAHQAVHEQASPLTAQNILELDTYCRQRYIDLVPNQNSLGHMEHWLAIYPHLAECPDGFTDTREKHAAPTTLNPTRPESLPFIRALYDEFLPNFQSSRFNAGCDEPWELGKCQNQSREKADLYLAWIQQLHTLITDHDRRMMMWADIINHYPEQIPALPPDLIMLEWGYEATHDFDTPCQQFADAGLDFYVCPGTSSWNALVGRHQNMIENVNGAIEAAQRYDADGLLMTDWGDNGHWQPLPVSYAGFVYAAAQAWNPGATRPATLPDLLNRHIFQDKAGIVGEVCEQSGNLYRLNQCDYINGQLSAYALHWSPQNIRHNVQFYYEEIAGKPVQLTIKQLDTLVQQVDDALNTLSRHQMECDDATLVAGELTQAAALLRHGAQWLRLAYFQQGDPAALARDIARLIPEQRELWLKRNRRGGLEDSLRPLYRLQDHYRQMTDNPSD